MTEQEWTPGLPDTARHVAAVVIGGGLAGLLSGYRLAQTKAHDAGEILVLEASGTLGGAVSSHRLGGLDLDAGAESFALRGGDVAALIAELGLGEDLVTPNPAGAWVRLPQGPRELPRTGVLGIPANPWDPEVRRTLGFIGSLRASLDRLIPASVGTRAAESSVATLVKARQGRRVLTRLVEPVVGGVHAADPALLDVDMVAPGLRSLLKTEGSLSAAVTAQRVKQSAAANPGQPRGTAKAGSAVGGIRGGMHRLISALAGRAAELGVEIRTNTPVARLQQSRRADGTTSWTVQTAAGERFSAPEVVVALDGPAAVDLLSEVVPGIKELRPGHGAQVSLVTLIVDAPTLDAAPRGTGILVAPQVSDVQAKALTHASAKWPWLRAALPEGRHVLRLSYGRQEGAAVVPSEAQSDEALTAAALADASELLGVALNASQLVEQDVIRWNGALPFAALGHRRRVARARELASAQPGLHLVGAWLAGTGLAAIVRDTNRIFDFDPREPQHERTLDS